MSGPNTDSELLSPWSCFHCRRRKVRCNRRDPCSHCAQGGLECSFPVTGRMPTRRHDQVPSSNPRKKQAELLGRLRRLEGIVQTLGVQLEDETQQQATPTLKGRFEHAGAAAPMRENRRLQNGRGTDSGEELPSREFSKEFGRLTISDRGTVYTGNRIWNIVIDELKSIRMDVEIVDKPNLDANEKQSVEPNIGSLPFLCGHTSIELDMLQPLPSQVSYIWEVFVERVDPFVKVLHIPTMARAVRSSIGTSQQVSKPTSEHVYPSVDDQKYLLRWSLLWCSAKRKSGHFSCLTPEMTALMFAISLVAIASLSEVKVMNSFGEPKDRLLARYALGAEQALARADILTTTNLVAIQALAIYLEAINLRKGSSVAWSLTGMLIRAAESMGLHRDGPPLSSIVPFELEMRRRLWWHICFLDSKVSDCRVSEVSISGSIFDTQQPINLNDADVNPDMTASPAAQRCFADLSICLIQCDLWRLGRDIRSSMSSRTACDSEARCQILDEVLQKARTKFTENWVRYLEVENPLHSFIEAFVRGRLILYELAIHHRGMPAATSGHGHYPAGEQDAKYFVTALACIESMLALEAPDRPESGKWAWFAQSHVPWPAITTILMQLRTQPWGPTWDRAWTAVKRTRDYIPEVALKEPFHQPLHTLMGAVLKHRSEELERLQTLPNASRHLRQLAVAPRSELESGMWKLSADRMSFETSAVEERLKVEMRVSSGGTCSAGNIDPSIGMDDLACISSLEDGWDNIVAFSPTVGVAKSPPFLTAAAKESEGEYDADALGYSVDYWLWNEVLEGGEAP